MKKKFLSLFFALCFFIPSIFLISGCDSGNQKPTIYFMVDGEEYSNYETQGNEKIQLPKDPIKEGYTFIGWFLDDGFKEVFDENSYESKSIKKDFNVYGKFVINKYSIIFNTDGGSTVLTITQDYMSSITPPTEPTKDGYVFSGWYTDGETFENEYTFSTMPLNGVTLYAKWDIETYTITYHLDGGINGDNPASYTIETNNIVLESATKTGYTFDGWYTEQSYTNQIETIDTSLLQNYNLYAKFVINQYTITFNTNEGSTIAPITQDYNSVVTKPVDPTRDGYIFDGWYTDNGTFANEYTFSTMPLNGIILYAKWNIETYTITYHLDGGINGDNPTSYTIETNNIVLESATKTGYTFDGWYTEQSYINKIETIDTSLLQNYNLYAKFVINKYTITFNTNEGSTISPITQDYNSTVTKPADPTKDGYIFDGWYTDNGTFKREYTFSTMPLNGVTVYAKWLEIFSIKRIGSGYGITGVTRDGRNLKHIVVPSNISGYGDIVSIEASAFSNCVNLRSVDLGKSIKLSSIGNEAFYGCYNLMTIVLPSSLKTIGLSAFASSPILFEVYNLSSLSIEAGNPNYDYGSMQFIKVVHKSLDEPSCVQLIDNVVYFILNSECIALEGSDFSAESIKLDARTTSIYASAFNQFKLSFLDLSECVNLETIGEGAFHFCQNLTSIDLSGCTNLKVIDKNAFSDCSAAASINLSECMNLETIGENAFDGCDSLSKIDLGKCTNLSSIGESAFAHCECLTSIILPSSLKSIGTNAFDSCYSLVEVYNLSTLRITLGSSAYGEVGYFAKVIHSSIDEPTRIQVIDKIQYYVYETDFIAIALIDDSVFSAKLDSRTTAIKSYAFFYGHLYTIDLSSCINLTIIEEYAFARNYFTSIDLSKCTNLTIIGEEAFWGCTDLSSIKLPKSLEEIKSDAFRNCENLVGMDLSNCDNLIRIGSSAFDGCDSMKKLFIPSGYWYVSSNELGTMHRVNLGDLISTYNMVSYFIDTYQQYYWHRVKS